MRFSVSHHHLHEVLPRQPDMGRKDLVRAVRNLFRADDIKNFYHRYLDELKKTGQDHPEVTANSDIQNILLELDDPDTTRRWHNALNEEFREEETTK